MPTFPHIPDGLCHGPFLGSVARRSGLLTQKQLHSRAWRRLFADVYASAAIPDSLGLRIRAARLLLPAGAVVSGTAAAFVHGADIRRRGEGLDVTVTVPRDLPFHPRAGLTIRRAELLPEDSETVAGIPVTTPIRTAFDLARRPAVRRNLTEHVVAADALTHKGFFTPEDLAAYACRGRFRGWRGIRQVDQVAAHTEPLTESPGETRVRMRIVLAGLPRPQAQVDIRTPGGAFIGRADLAYPELRVVIEYDGAWHDSQRVHDAARRNRMREAGWQVYVYTSRDLRPGDPTIVRQMRALFPGNPC